MGTLVKIIIAEMTVNLTKEFCWASFPLLCNVLKNLSTFYIIGCYTLKFYSVSRKGDE